MNSEISEAQIPQIAREAGAVEKYRWDKGVDFDKARADLIAAIARYRNAWCREAATFMCEAEVLLIQLVNGARVSEALEAWRLWMDADEHPRVVVVKVRKLGKVMICDACKALCSTKSKKNSPALHTLSNPGHATFHKKEQVEGREMVIPPECDDDDVGVLNEWALLPEDISRDNVRMFSMRKMGYNTHSLRYSFETKQAALGTPSQVIAKITHQRSDRLIVDYTNQKAADKMQREFVEALSRGTTQATTGAPSAERPPQ